MTNNNYLKILLHLKQFEGDGKFHEIESVLGDIDQKTKRDICQELAHEDLIYLDGGQMTGLPLMGFGDGRGNVKWIGGPDENSEYIPFSGKLKFKGSKYLKEEIEMTEQGKYNIKVDGNSTANVIISSPGATITNKTEIIDQVKNIVDNIKNDDKLNHSEKQEAIEIFNQLENEIKIDNPKPATIEKVITMGAKIASIGSLVINLIRLLSGH